MVQSEILSEKHAQREIYHLHDDMEHHFSFVCYVFTSAFLFVSEKVRTHICAEVYGKANM